MANRQGETAAVVVFALLAWVLFYAILFRWARADEGWGEGVRCPVGIPEYVRKTYKHWTDEDHDCRDVRHEVLERDSEIPVTWNEKGCRVIAGKWTGPYGGKVFTDPKDIQVDHMVPLGNAHYSGGWTWNSEKRERYANWLGDSHHLRATEGRLNQSKGRRDPSEWMPEKNKCSYVSDWLRIKDEWDLTLTVKEAVSIYETMRGCEEAFGPLWELRGR